MNVSARSTISEGHPILFLPSKWLISS